MENEGTMIIPIIGYIIAVISPIMAFCTVQPLCFSRRILHYTKSMDDS